MAGSKQRHNVQGNVVMGRAEDIQHLRRMSTGELHQIFLQAKEQGQVRLVLDDEIYTLHRHPDHTFTLEAGNVGHMFI